MTASRHDRGAALLAAALAFAAALALGACGGGDSGSGGGTAGGKPAKTGAAAVAAPTPAGTVFQAGAALSRAIAVNDCNELFAVAQHSTKRDAKLSKANAPPTKAECASLKRFARGLRGYVPRASQTFGSAGIVDARVGRSPVTSVFVADLDGRWKEALAYGSPPQVGTTPEPANKFDANVAKWVRAARGTDCRAIFRLLSKDSFAIKNAGGTYKAFCAAIAIKNPRSFFVRVSKDPTAKPVALGKTREFAFYGLSVKPGIYYTLVAARQPDRVPLTPEHERDAVFNWYLAKE